MESIIPFFRDQVPNLDSQTKNRLLNKIAHADRQIHRLVDKKGGRSHRRYAYWWNLKKKLEDRLYGPMGVIKFLDMAPPNPQFKKDMEDLERLKDCFLCKMGIPSRRYVMGFDAASEPDRSSVMMAIEGKFSFAEELTRNHPY
jgi:hypothetical protein